MPNSITITDLDQETFELLKAAARRCGVDLNSLAGTWSDSDFEEFHEAISDFEKVDEGMWQ